MKCIISGKFKNHLNKTVNNNILGISFKNIRTINGINENLTHKMLELQDVIGYKHNSLGIIEINREHKNNILTIQFMEDLRRSLEAMEIDEYTKSIVMHPKKGDIFSLGSDINTLYFAKKTNNPNLIDNYFKKLYDFQNFIASYHKPLVTIGSGQSEGSGVTMLAHSPFSTSSKNSTAAFNETKLGYIPDGGSIYLLSRLTGEVGIYLALTGNKLSHGDMRRLNITDGLIDDQDFLKEHLIVNLVNTDISASLNDPLGELWEKKFEDSKKKKMENNPFDLNDTLTINGKMKFDFLSDQYKEPYQYPWLRTSNQEDFRTSPMTNIFNKEIFGENSKQEILNSYKLSQRKYTNTFENFQSKVFFGVLENNHLLNNIEGTLKNINNYFRFNTVKEIIENMQNNPLDPFARECLEKISERSQLALEVTLSLIRKAKNLDYEECQRLEMNAAKNIILKSKDIDNFMENRGKNKNKKKNLKENSPSQDLVKEIIEFPSGTEKIELETKKNSILPNRTYRDEFPDVFRLWINEHPRANRTIRQFFDYEIKHYMIEKLGIDLRDTRITIDEVRNVISKIYTKNFSSEKENEKIYNLISDNNFIEEYLKTRKEFCEKYLKEADNIPKIKNLIAFKTAEIFEKSFKKTCRNILIKCKDIRDIDKRRTWHRLRKWIFSNRIMSYKTKEQIMQNLRIASLGEKSLYIPHDESKSWRDETNPDLVKSPFYQLAGLFKLKKISPEYALKFSTTDLNSNKLFEYLEINQEKLLEIQEITKKNPKKLIELFDSALDKETKDLFDSIEEKSLLEYDRLYRIRNNNKSPIDEMNMITEFKFLKNKWFSYRNNILEIIRKITIDSIYKIVENPAFYNVSRFENKKTPEEIKNEDIHNHLTEEDMDDYKCLFSVLKQETDDMEFFDEKKNVMEGDLILSSLDSRNLIESIKNSFVGSNEKVFGSIIDNISNEENLHVKKFSEKSFDFTKSLILHFLLENKNSENNKTENKKPVKIEEFDVQESLNKLFAIENFSEKNLKNSSEDSNTNKFIHFLYIKYGSVNIFKEALKNTKNTAVEILDQLTESELNQHYNKLVQKIPEENLNKIKAIYQKEKLLFENLLKEYYEMKINLQKLEVIQIENSDNVTTEIPYEYNNIDYFIEKLKDIAFNEFILADRTQKCPINIDMLIKKEYSKENNLPGKERQLVELYVSLKENFINTETQRNLSALTKSMKKTEWFNTVDSYTKNIHDGNLSDLVNEYSKNGDIDFKIENFMKIKFRDLIYEDNKQSEENEAIADKVFLTGEATKKFDMDFINELTLKYRVDQVKLNDSIYEIGLMKNGPIFSNRNHLNNLKIQLTNKINEFLKNYNINELTKKYIDYIYNNQFHLHRILCNIVEIENFYNLKTPQEIQEFNQYIYYGDYLLKFKKLINETKKNFTNKNSGISNFNKLENLRNLTLNQKKYVENLNNAKNFLEVREKYLEKIYSEFYGLFNFSEKYQINSMVNNIQADFSKLYNYLKDNYENKNNSLNFVDFIVNDEIFHKNFNNLNFDELFGLEKIELIKNKIDMINSQKIHEEAVITGAGGSFVSNREMRNIIQNLVTEEIIKTSTINFDNENKIDECIDLILQKEKEILQNIEYNGFNLKSSQAPNNDAEKKELISEYKIKFKNFYNFKNNKSENFSSGCPIDFTSNNTQNFSQYDSKNKFYNEENFPKNLQEKISAKLFSLKQLEKISENSSSFTSDNKLNNISKIDLDSDEIEINKENLENIISKNKDYGLKYNNVLKYMTGDKLTLRDMILNSYDKTLKDYNENELSKIFTEKIPVELIKITFQVLDAKLIKAVKIINSELLLNENKKKNKIQHDLLNIINPPQDEEQIINKLNEYYPQDDFNTMDLYKDHLEARINTRDIERKNIEEQAGKTPEDEAFMKKLQRREERNKQINIAEDRSYKYLTVLSDVKKNSNENVLKLENGSVFDRNILENVRSEIYENFIEKETKKKQKKIQQKLADEKLDEVDTQEILEEYIPEEEDEYSLGKLTPIKKEFDPTKLSDSELKEIYLGKIEQIVEIPNFKNKYSLLKYVYDYYMGTLAVDYDSHFKDAEERLSIVSEAVYLDRIEKSYYNYSRFEEFKKGAGILEHKYHEKYDTKFENLNKDENYKISDFEKSYPYDLYEKTLFPHPMDKELYGNIHDEEELKMIDNYRNSAFDFIKMMGPTRVILPETKNRYLEIMKYEVNLYVEGYTYNKMVKDKKKDQIYDKFSSKLMTSTEKFRKQAAKDQKRNEEISAMPFNTAEGQVGYNKLAFENEEKNKKNSLNENLDKFINKTFENYLQVRKEKINYQKEKLNDVKQNISHTGNSLLRNPYDLIKLSNQEYLNFKNFKDFDQNLPNIPDTVNPESPIKLDIENFIKINSMQKELPGFNNTDITEIVDLDNAMSFASFGKYSSIPHWLVDEAESENKENYLMKYLESTPEKFIEFSIEEIVEDFYLTRHEIERNLTREELKSFDLENREYFSLENISNLLKIKLNELILNIHIMQDEAEYSRNNSHNEYIQSKKIPNQQFYYNQSIHDEDAFFRSVAYRLRLDKIKEDKISKHFKSTNSKSKKIPKNINNGLDDRNSFEFWYYNNLYTDKYRRNPDSGMSYEEKAENQKQKLFKYINRESVDENFTSEAKMENAKFLVEYGENNLDKRERISRLKATDVINELKKKSSRYNQSEDLKEFFSDKI